MRSLSCVVATFAGLIVSGCTTLQAQSRVDPQSVAYYPAASSTYSGAGQCVTGLAGDVRLGAINLDCLTIPGSATSNFYLSAVDSPTNRNRLASILIKQSDDICTVELGRLTANQAMVNAGLGIATSAFATAGSIVTGQLAGNILSGLAAGTNASRDHINAEVYRNALSTAVTKAISDERDRQRGVLLTNFSKGKEYTIDQAIMEVNRYHQVCSFYQGLQLVVKAVDRAGLYGTNPRNEAAIALNSVRMQVAAIERKLARPAGRSEGELAQLQMQKDAMVAYETELMKAWVAAPVVPASPGAPQVVPETPEGEN